jgi:pimeloyl-ACP methyl ester carboxylesterase
VVHQATLDNGRIPQEFWNWQMALQRHTNHVRNECAQYAAVRSIRHGFDPALIPERSWLRGIETPTHLLAAPDDPFGNRSVAEQLVNDLPNAELEIVPDIGHWPWIHDPDLAAKVVANFLTAGRSSASDYVAPAPNAGNTALPREAP